MNAVVRHGLSVEYRSAAINRAEAGAGFVVVKADTGYVQTRFDGVRLFSLSDARAYAARLNAANGTRAFRVIAQTPLPGA